MEPDFLQQVYSQALYFHERLALIVSKGIKQAPANPQMVEERLNTWKELAAQGNQQKFEQRLSWFGAKDSQIKLALCPDFQIHAEEFPEWVTMVGQLHNATLQWDEGSICHSPISKRLLPFEPNQQLPFYSLFLPVLHTARKLLSQRLKDLKLSEQGTVLEDSAWLNLENILLHDLCNASANVLGLTFTEYRPESNSILPMIIPISDAEESKGIYQAFIQYHTQNGLRDLFLRYPVWARIIATFVLHWVESTAQFIARWQRDYQEIVSQLGVNSNPPKLSSIKGGVSDRHNRGHTVLLLTLSNHQKLVYKPRSLSSEFAFSHLLDWLNSQGAATSFKTLRVLDKTDYGWVLDYVEKLPCLTQGDAEAFYQRAGGLLCLSWVLGSNDLHSENIIANGDQPVIIDNETLMHPVTSLNSEDEDLELFDSVLRTGMLPHWEFNAQQDKAYDISGLGNVTQQDAPWEGLRWKYVNTDYMVLKPEQSSIPEKDNIPYLNKQPLSPDLFLNEIKTGFTTMYRLLHASKPNLLFNRELMADLATSVTRFLFRPTEVYGALLEKSCLPQCLVSGVARSLDLETTCQLYFSSEFPEGIEATLKCELDALHQLDIPFFQCRANENILKCAGDVVLHDYFERDGYSAFLRRLDNLNENSHNLQLSLIKGTLDARQVRPAVNSGAKESCKTCDSKSGNESDHEIATAPAEENIFEVSRKLSEKLLDSAVTGRQNYPTWLALTYVERAERYQFQPIGHSLYEGNMGISVFLHAYCTAFPSDPRFLDIAQSALTGISNNITSIDSQVKARFASQMGLGGARGLGSIVYGFCVIADITDNDHYLFLAEQAANLITEERITTCNQPDVIEGLAGTLLALIKLYHCTQNERTLQLCRLCSDQILSLRMYEKGQFKGWNSITSAPLTGYSHGASGILHALTKLQLIEANEERKAAIRQGLSFEQGCYSATASNWPDYRQNQNEQEICANSWCHGAPGIVLARLGILELMDTKSIRKDIENGIRGMLNRQRSSIDHVCCGEMGIIEVLFTASEKLGRTDYQEMAFERLGTLLSSNEAKGDFTLFSNMGVDVSSPGFFQGYSGICYSLLRMKPGSNLPNILLLE